MEKIIAVMNMTKRLGGQTICLQSSPTITGYASVVGKMEGEGPLKSSFDYISDDSYFGEKTWEKAESAMLKQCFDLSCGKAGIAPSSLNYIFSGDLLNQCMGSSIALKDSGVPYFGLYGACSTMGESLSLTAMSIDGGFADMSCALTSSHFCSSERQYRFPLEYGGVRAPTAQWTVTGAGSVIIGAHCSGPCVTHITTGCITDAGIVDATNMGAAMAPSAYATLKAHFADTGRDPRYYDAIFTGDLGKLGHDILQDLFHADGVDLGAIYTDCGILIYDSDAQDVHAGGSGCGCSASVLCGHILRAMEGGVWNKVLFAPTGALLSPTSSQQGDSIPGICHAVAIENLQ